MAINTPQKRSATLEIPGIMMNPFPDGVIGVTDRKQMSDLYPIATAAPIVPPNETCWPMEHKPASPWLNEKKGSSIWSKEKVGTSTWSKEREVGVCQD